MKFKQFIQLDELMGQYGSVKNVQGPMGIHGALKRLHVQPIQDGGPSRVRRSLAAGKCRNPNRPARLTRPGTPMVVPSVLENIELLNITQELLSVIKSKIDYHYQKLSEKYGPTIAKLIIGSAIIGSFLPIPGSTIIAALPFLGLGEFINRLKKRPKIIYQLEKDYDLDKAKIELDKAEFVADLKKVA
jgi:hypothetical protein